MRARTKGLRLWSYYRYIITSTIHLQMPRKYFRTSSRATSYTKEELQLAMQKIKNKELTYADNNNNNKQRP